MEKDLLSGQIGPEAKYDIAFVDSKLQCKLDYQGKEMGGGAYMSLGAGAVLDAFAAKFPGHFTAEFVSIAKSLMGI